MISTKGICTLSNIPLRKEADSRSEIVSMLLFGEMYQMLEVNTEWVQIQTDHDSYLGWISLKQHTQLHKAPTKMGTVTDYPFAILQGPTGLVMAPTSSRLPDIEHKSCFINGLEYTINNAPKTLTQTDLVYIAKQFTNTPYLWGGRTAFGIDCSGFVQAIYKCIGIQLKRDAYQQAEMGETIAFLEETQAGDLAFFDNAEGRITHVGMMLDQHTIIHASGRVRVDSVDSHGILNNDDKNYSHKLRIIKRIIS